jgi:hypothetical protein
MNKRGKQRKKLQIETMQNSLDKEIKGQTASPTTSESYSDEVVAAAAADAWNPS